MWHEAQTMSVLLLVLRIDPCLEQLLTGVGTRICREFFDRRGRHGWLTMVLSLLLLRRASAVAIVPEKSPIFVHTR